MARCLVYAVFSLFLFAMSVHGAVKIGTPIFDPPFANNDQHDMISGYDIQLMGLICTNLQWQCEFIPLSRDQLLKALLDNKIDYAIGSIAITPKRQISYLFSEPYFLTSGGFLVSPDSPLTTFNPINGKKIGVMTGTIYADYLANHPSFKVSLHRYNTVAEMAIALKNKEVDGLFINYYSALYLSHEHANMVKALHDKINVGNGMGVATRYGNEKGIALINRAINQFEADGSFVMLYKYYFAFCLHDMVDPNTNLR